ncbi:MAG TPA: hypothetical protein VM784_14290 [Actinomycetota bacterium]|nr:hypothetical protein [Actinomycetota bacterium]
MPEVIELRVHGVGGSTPAQILGEESDEHTLRTAGDHVASFHARKRNLRVEGYVWGRLTSRALLQPLWLLLLPFTLINVAGWMHPPEDEVRPWTTATLHALLRLEGLVLTATYVLWLSAILLEGVFYQWGLGGRIADADDRFWWGAAALTALGTIVLLAARSAQRGFECVRGPRPASDYNPDEAAPPAPILGARMRAWVGDVVRWATFPVRARNWVTALEVPPPQSFTDPEVWHGESKAQSFLFAHAWIALITFVVLVLTLRDEVAAGLAALPIEEPIRIATLVQVLIVVMLAVTHMLGRKGEPSTARFRWCGPAVATSTAIGLSTGFFYGIFRLAQERLTRAPLPATIRPEWNIGRPVLEMGVAFGVSIFVTALVVIALLIYTVRRAVRELRVIRADPRSPDLSVEDAKRVVPLNSAPAGREPNGLTGSGFQLALARSSSDSLTMTDLVLTAPAIVFTVIVLLPWVPSGRVWNVVGRAGDVLAIAGAAALLAFLIRRAYRPADRRLVGILWDVMTFFPRRHHPLAVRPYAERAVPELRHRLYFHTLAKNRRVLLAGHSQGSIIAFAALACSERQVLERISLLTYGSPLRSLYGRFFPAYFPPALIRDLEQRLRSPDGHPEWHNFFRRTDYIGKDLFEGIAPPAGSLDQEVPDPAGWPLTETLDLDLRLPPWPDPVRTSWSDIARHSFYNNEVVLQTWLHDEKLRIGREAPQVPGEKAR